MKLSRVLPILCLACASLCSQREYDPTEEQTASALKNPAPPASTLNTAENPKLKGQAPGNSNRALSVAIAPVPPEKEEYAKVQSVTPLTPEQQKLFDQGRILYGGLCAPCHQPNGQGVMGLAPPVVDTHWVLGSVERLTRIVLQGMRGPVTVRGVVYDLEMPALAALDDEQIASVLTYVRREWGHTASAVEPETVARIREETAERDEAWTEAELLNLP